MVIPYFIPVFAFVCLLRVEGEAETKVLESGTWYASVAISYTHAVEAAVCG